MQRYRQPQADTHVVSVAGTGPFDYEFTVEGNVGKLTDNGHLSSDGADVVNNGDGTVTVMGSDGDTTMGDSWEVTGNMTDFTVTPVDGDPIVFLNGLSTTATDVVNRISASTGSPTDAGGMSQAETAVLIVAGAVLARLILG